MNIERRLTADAQALLAAAHAEMKSMNQGAVSTGHILLASFTVPGLAISELLAEAGTTEETFRDAVRATYVTDPQNGSDFDRSAMMAMNVATTLADRENSPISAALLIMGALLSPDDKLDSLLALIDLDRDRLTHDIESFNGPASDTAVLPARPEAPKQRSKGSKTAALELVGTNLTEAAREGKLDPIVGRTDEVMRVISVLCRRQKANPVLVGEAGVGKTAIAEGLALRMVADDVPLPLKGHELWSIDLGSLIAGTTYRGDFEKRLKEVIKEASAGNVILFIDEVHSVVGSGASSGGVGAADLLKPALARGEIRVVGATTNDEYRKGIEKDPALERRFSKVEVNEPTEAVAVSMLDAIRPRYEAYHGVRYTDAALLAAVRLSARHLSDRQLPDKAIDLIDEAAAAAAMAIARKDDPVKQMYRDRAEAIRALLSPTETPSNEESIRLVEQEQKITEALTTAGEVVDTGQITEHAIAEVISQRTGVPSSIIDDNEAARLLSAETHLSSVVIGQDHAVRALSRTLRRRRAGISAEKRPPSFLFVGPSGVGKTQTAKALAEFLFGSEDDMHRIDMSEYMEAHTVARLIGAPPGYVGYDDPGQLTESVRRKPYSVLLLDELDKAHPKVVDVLLQVLEDGQLTDGTGKKVDFSNTIIIMTANSVATTSPKKSIGFGSASTVDDHKERHARNLKALKDAYRPEFLNRLDDVITFDPLSIPDLCTIAELMIARPAEQLLVHGHELVVEASALEYLASQGYDPFYGARPLRRAIQTHVEDKVAELLLTGTVPPNSTLVLSAPSGEGIEIAVTERVEQRAELATV